LANGTFSDVIFTRNITGFAYGNYSVAPCAWLVPDETNTANNNFTGGTVYVGIPSNVSCNSTVDISDAIILSGNFLGTIRQ
jgi:hypothetical protein